MQSSAENSTVSIRAQPRNALSPMRPTPRPMLTVLTAEQFSKLCAPIPVTVSGITTEVICVFM